jgi:putative membrane protein
MKRSWERWAVLGAMVMAMGAGAQPQDPKGKQPHHKMDPKADQAAQMGRRMVADGAPAFLAQLRAINETEIALGELSQQKASSPAVKQYGEHMVQDHRKADQQLLDFAKQRGLQLPSRAQPTNDVQTRLLNATEATKAKLWVLDGPLYDQAYLASQVANHDEVIQLVTLARQQYPDLAPLLDGLLPTLREHRDRAYQLLGQAQPQAQAGQPQPEQTQQRQARPPAGERR